MFPFFSLGISDAGVPIEGVVIGSGTINNLIVATHHGNEYAGTETARALALSLANDMMPGQRIPRIPNTPISQATIATIDSRLWGPTNGIQIATTPARAETVVTSLNPLKLSTII